MSCANVPKGIFWWLWSGCPPLPIPNREVKPRIADDTAHVRGKVGRRQSFTEGVSDEAPFFLFYRFDRFDRFYRWDRYDSFFSCISFFFRIFVL